MTINLTPILQALIGLLAALITYRLIPWIKARTTSEQQGQLRAATKIAVFAAEQLFGAGHGNDKLNYAMDWLEEHGYTVDRAQIEAALYEEINSGFFSIDSVNISAEGKEKPPEDVAMSDK